MRQQELRHRDEKAVLRVRGGGHLDHMTAARVYTKQTGVSRFRRQNLYLKINCVYRVKERVHRVFEGSIF